MVATAQLLPVGSCSERTPPTSANTWTSFKELSQTLHFKNT